MTDDAADVAVLVAAVTLELQPIRELVARLIDVIQSQQERIEKCELELLHLRPAPDGESCSRS